MRNLAANIRYAIRQFRLSPVFTAAAIITLALGIGGTTAIFTLMDAIMLRSLPVSDPGRLYRVGDGYECCVEGGPQDRWGMFSYPLFERLKSETPEFEEVTAFQAGPWRSSVRRQGSTWQHDLYVPNTLPEPTFPYWECAPSAGACSLPMTIVPEPRRSP
jgi:hypothetical protein